MHINNVHISIYLYLFICIYSSISTSIDLYLFPFIHIHVSIYWYSAASGSGPMPLSSDQRPRTPGRALGNLRGGRGRVDEEASGRGLRLKRVDDQHIFQNRYKSYANNKQIYIYIYTHAYAHVCIYIYMYSMPYWRYSNRICCDSVAPQFIGCSLAYVCTFLVSGLLLCYN